MEGLAGSPMMEGAQQAEALGLGRHRGPTVHTATARRPPHMAFQCWAQC